jgi:type II secretory pathway pseudopilin PulG
MSGRRGITFIEVMAAIAIFSAVVTTALVSMRAARESMNNAALERRAREVLQTWRISQATEEPMEEEFEDEDGWLWRVIDEANEITIDVSDEQIEAARNAPDMDTAMRLLGVEQPTGDPTSPDGEPEAEVPDLTAPLLQISWSVIRVEALPPDSEAAEPFVVLRWRYIEGIESDTTIALALAAGSSSSGRAGAEVDAATVRDLRAPGASPGPAGRDRIIDDRLRTVQRQRAGTSRADLERQRAQPQRVRRPEVPGQGNPRPKRQEDRRDDR